MYCTECGKAPTKNKANKGGNRTIDPITKICNECEQRNNGDAVTGAGGAKRKNSLSDAADSTLPTIPEDIAKKSGADLSAEDIYTIVTTAIQGTNKKIDDLKGDIQNKIITLENRVKILEKENEKKDDDINVLKHTVISMQRSFNSMDQNERSTNAIIQHLSENDIDGTEPGEKLTSDIEKIRHICKLMEHNMDEESIQNLNINRIGQKREGMPRMIKIVFPNMNERDAFVKNSSKIKNAPDIWKKVYVKKDQHPVYVNENNRLRKKMVDLRKLPNNKDKEIFIKNGKLTIDGIVVDQNLFFH